MLLNSFGSSIHLVAEQVHAGPELLQHFPPLLLIVGGTEILMAENLQLAQKAQVCITKLKNDQLKWMIAAFQLRLGYYCLALHRLRVRQWHARYTRACGTILRNSARAVVDARLTRWVRFQTTFISSSQAVKFESGDGWHCTGKLALANAGKFLSESPTLKLPTLADGAASPVAGGAYGVISFISTSIVKNIRLIPARVK